jgi:pyruvyltransferase
MLKELLKRIKRPGTRGANRTSTALPYPHVHLEYWRPGDSLLNFGDMLSYIIVSKVLSNNGLTLTDETPRQARLLAVGSILHFAKSGDVVWGSGINGKVPLDLHCFSTLDVRAVRGPLTAEYLRKRGITVPDVYGDPALLLPQLFGERFVPTKKRQYAVVPNLHDLGVTENWPNIVSPLMAWNRCIEQIVEAEFVVASSLHGLIVAEAFGIPARYIRLSETESLLKYEDYVVGTGRTSLEYARTIEEALEMKGMPAIVFDPEGLIKSFPLDLWHSKMI